MGLPHFAVIPSPCLSAGFLVSCAWLVKRCVFNVDCHVADIVTIGQIVRRHGGSCRFHGSSNSAYRNLGTSSRSFTCISSRARVPPREMFNALIIGVLVCFLLLGKMIHPCQRKSSQRNVLVFSDNILLHILKLIYSSSARASRLEVSQKRLRSGDTRAAYPSFVNIG